MIEEPMDEDKLHDIARKFATELSVKIAASAAIFAEEHDVPVEHAYIMLIATSVKASAEMLCMILKLPDHVRESEVDAIMKKLHRLTFTNEN